MKFLVVMAVGAVVVFPSCGVLEESRGPKLTAGEIGQQAKQLRQDIETRVRTTTDPATSADDLAKLERAKRLAQEARTLAGRSIEVEQALRRAEDAASRARQAAQLGERLVAEAEARVEQAEDEFDDATGSARSSKHEALLSRQRALAELDDLQEQAEHAADLAIDEVEQLAEDQESSWRTSRSVLQRANSLFLDVTDPSPIVYPPYFRVHTGAATISPYTVSSIGTNALKLEPSTTTAWYVETDFLYRTAWLSPNAVSEDLYDWYRLQRLVPQDYEVRLGFVNASKLDTGDDPLLTREQAAGGDWFAEATLGWVLGTSGVSRQQDLNSDLPRGTWNVELNGGFHTDRNGLHTTGTYQIGLGTTWGIPMTVGTKKQLAQLAGGVFFGIHEYPNTDPNGEIHREDQGVPYNRRGSFGIKLDLTVPMTDSFSAVVQGRHYSVVSNNSVPDDWSLFVGVTVAIGRLLGNT